jgi:hypothetical protein
LEPIDMLKKILGEDIKESPEEFQEWLGALSKDQLIAEMVRKKESGGWKSDDESDAGSKKGDKENGNGGNADDGGWNTGGGDQPAANGGSWDTAATPVVGGWSDPDNKAEKATSEKKKEKKEKEKKAPEPHW